MIRKLMVLLLPLCMAGIAAAADNVAVEIWTGSTSTNIEDLVGTGVRPVYPGAANMSWRTNLFELPTGDNKTAQFPGFPNPADNYLGRIFAYIVPPATGAYTFWLCTDDDGRLWLSTDESPDNATQICAIDGWLPANDFNTGSGSGGHTNIRSAARTLTAGQKYYIEAAVKEGGGGDHIYVHWDGPAPIGSSHLAIAEQYLAKVIRVQDLPAQNPDPANGARLSVSAKLLSWTAGAYAAQHHVYFGTNATDVANGTGGTDKGLQPLPSYLVLGLVPGTTYYWRVDEVNDATPGSPWTGPVWSFRIASLKAESPNPPNGAVNIVKNSSVSWLAGYGAIASYVYMGTSPGALQQKTLTQATSYTPTGQADGTTYYWRIDSIDGSMNVVQGDVWSYTTIPTIPIKDPNLVGYWPLDEGAGTVAIDWSGHDNHGTLTNGPQWVEGYLDGAVQFDGVDDRIVVPNAPELCVTSGVTIMAWIRAARYAGPGGADWQGIMAKGNDPRSYSLYTVEAGGVLHLSTAGIGTTSTTAVPLNEWAHVAAMVDGGAHTYYINGVYAGGGGSGVVLPGTTDVSPVVLGATWETAGTREFQGLIDDARIYNKALTQEQVVQAMRGNPLMAWGPNPANGASVSIDQSGTLSWMAGDLALQHDVYVGQDATEVTNATTATAGIYKGRQAGTTYALTAAMGQRYYWRIDEVNSDSTITKGRVWSFSVLDYLVVDDFESYGDVATIGAPGQRIWYVWLDGLGYNNPPPGYAGNGSGSMVDLSTAVVNSGQQALRMDFNNTVVPYSVVEAATSNLLVGSNWNREGVKALALHFRGYPASTGSVSTAGGQITVTGSGADIWDVLYPGQAAADGYHDEFHFVYVALAPGTHTIQAKVESIVNTNGWAKAGVMMRTSLTGGSSHTIAAVTPSNGLGQQWRLTDGAAMAWGDTNRDPGSVAPATAPAWVRLTRVVDGTIEARFSMDGTTWNLMHTNPAPTIPMNPPSMYLGLAVTSHNAGATTTVVFSNVTVNGNPISGYSNQDIGILSNSTDPLYVILKSGATSQRVVHPNPAAIQNAAFQQWNIALSAFSPVPVGNVTNIGVGTGTPGGALGKTGIVYVDDIRLYPPRYVAGMLPPWPEDLVQDGTINLRDVEALVADWLEDDYYLNTVQPTGPVVAHYSFEQAVNDSSGNGHNGTAYGNPTYIAGKIGYAIKLDGVDDYVGMGGIGVTAAAARTIAGWVKADSMDVQGWTNVFGFTHDGTDGHTNRHFDIQRLGNQGGGYGLHVHGWERPIMAFDTDWHYLAATYDGATMRWYGDGRPVGSEVRVLNTAGTFHVGKRADLDRFFSGLMDEISVYSRALSEAELGWLAANGAAQWYVPVLSPANLSDAEPQGSRIVNFKDLAVLLSKFLQTQVWPAP